MALIKRYFPQRGDECGRAVNTSNSRTGVRVHVKRRPLCCFFGQGTLLQFVFAEG